MDGFIIKKDSASGFKTAVEFEILETCAGAVDAAELGAELSRAFSAHPFLSTIKGTKTVMRILEVYILPSLDFLLKRATMAFCLLYVAHQCVEVAIVHTQTLTENDSHLPLD